MTEVSADPLVHHFKPRGSAIEAFHARDPEVVLSGPAGTGKSRAVLEKLHHMALINPGMRGLILRKTQVSLGSSALKTWRRDVVAEALANNTLRFYGGSAEEPAQYRYANGSTILVGGMDRPTKIMSTEYDFIFCQEATELTVTDWEYALTRLRNHRVSFQQIVADCNPDAPTHWLKARCDTGRAKMIFCRHEDNPVLFDELPDGSFELTEVGAEYMSKLDSLTGVRYLRLRKGLWCAAEGVIFDEFSPEVHVIDEMPAGWESWPRFWSVDFGFTNPFVCQMWAQDPDGRLYLYREFYMTQRTVDQHARDILKVITTADRYGNLTWNEPHPYAILADHDAENRARFENEIGQGTQAADKNVKDGIEVTQARFRLADDGKPRVFFLRTALVERDTNLEEARKPCSTLEELPGYVWAPSPDGRAVKEEPLKLNDHGCLVAGTLVLTRRGQVPIENVTMLDQVMTRRGWCSVLASGMTAERASLVRVALSDGRTVDGTPDHPFWVVGRGWVHMDALRYHDKLYSCPSSALSSAGSPSAVVRNHATSLNATISFPALPIGSAGCSICTSKYGKRLIEALFRKATRFTVQTSIRSTIIRTISSALLSPNIRTSIARKVASGGARLNVSPILPLSNRSPRCGTALRRVWLGTLNMLSDPDLARWAIGRSRASSAVKGSSTPRRAASDGSAQTDARRGIASPAALTTRTEPAHGAPSFSGPTGTAKLGTATVSVVAVHDLHEVGSVFNLTVEGEPEFFAGGVLVHNCDAMRYLMKDQDPLARPGIRIM